ncbi:hypothetical protein HK097_008542 [Rhizophlyctis rosea]|uniref:Uncharacterized protein n=1 Tax=Rhizophlyctis rosea TaxID=64517 RepID=A0AAD5SCE9_9FUNG|nr:hypothetical protein HK097_008542 [Rhizophlyctis rosea]
MSENVTDPTSSKRASPDSAAQPEAKRSGPATPRGSVSEVRPPTPTVLPLLALRESVASSNEDLKSFLEKTYNFKNERMTDAPNKLIGQAGWRLLKSFNIRRVQFEALTVQERGGYNLSLKSRQ